MIDGLLLFAINLVFVILAVYEVREWAEKQVTWMVVVWTIAGVLNFMAVMQFFIKMYLLS